MGFGTLLDALLLRSAAKAYARKLGPRLIHDYGASDTYNEVQIRAAIRRLKLPEQFIRIGFSAFMPEREFIKLGEGADNYTLLRNLYERFLPRQPSGEMDDAGAYRQSASLQTPNGS